MASEPYFRILKSSKQLISLAWLNHRPERRNNALRAVTYLSDALAEPTTSARVSIYRMWSYASCGDEYLSKRLPVSGNPSLKYLMLSCVIRQRFHSHTVSPSRCVLHGNHRVYDRRTNCLPQNQCTLCNEHVHVYDFSFFRITGLWSRSSVKFSLGGVGVIEIIVSVTLCGVGVGEAHTDGWSRGRSLFN